MSCTLFAFMEFLCLCYALVFRLFATQQKVDNVGLVPTNTY